MVRRTSGYGHVLIDGHWHSRALYKPAEQRDCGLCGQPLGPSQAYGSYMAPHPDAGRVSQRLLACGTCRPRHPSGAGHAVECPICAEHFSGLVQCPTCKGEGVVPAGTAAAPTDAVTWA